MKNNRTKGYGMKKLFSGHHQDIQGSCNAGRRRAVSVSLFVRAHCNNSVLLRFKGFISSYYRAGWLPKIIPTVHSQQEERGQWALSTNIVSWGVQLNHRQTKWTCLREILISPVTWYPLFFFFNLQPSCTGCSFLGLCFLPCFTYSWTCCLEWGQWIPPTRELCDITVSGISKWIQSLSPSQEW